MRSEQTAKIKVKNERHKKINHEKMLFEGGKTEQKARAESNLNNYDHRCINERSFEGSQEINFVVGRNFWGRNESTRCATVGTYLLLGDAVDGEKEGS